MAVKRAQARSTSRVPEATSSWRPGDTVFLLDVNVLIALIEPMHTHHARSHDWFSVNARAWATCPMTENAVLRIVGHSRYPEGPGTPAMVADILSGLVAQPGHQFWSDDLGMLEDPVIRRDKLLSHAQLTDTYLLALTVKHGGRLATFDRRLVTDAVVGGQEALHLIE